MPYESVYCLRYTGTITYGVGRGERLDNYVLTDLTIGKDYTRQRIREINSDMGAWLARVILDRSRFKGTIEFCRSTGTEITVIQTFQTKGAA